MIGNLNFKKKTLNKIGGTDAKTFDQPISGGLHKLGENTALEKKLSVINEVDVLPKLETNLETKKTDKKKPKK